MVKCLDGNVLQSDAQIICHQVNCLGVMGAGLALQIKNKYPSVFFNYTAFVNSTHDKTRLLGTTLFEHTEDGKIIANIFAQYGVSRTERMTHYGNLKDGLNYVKQYAIDHQLKTIAIPYKIGCGLGGGDWKIVKEIIYEIFDNDKDLIAKIYKI